MPTDFEDYRVGKRAKYWQILGEFGLISGLKRLFSVCTTVLDLDILR